MKITSRLLGKLATVAAAGLFGASASADTLRLSLGTPGTQSGIGGEFNANTIIGGDAFGAEANYVAYTGDPSVHATAFGASFQTFCIEYQEHFSPGTVYNYAISGVAMLGGTAAGDPISQGTAWLYSQFAQGTLKGYNYSIGSGREATAAKLQEAIWWLEGELSLSSAQVNANLFLKDQTPGTGTGVITHYGSEVNAQQDGFGIYGVSALNLGSGSGSGGTPNNPFQNQDQLIYRGGGFTRVPDGGTTLMLLGMALTGLAAVQRRFRKI